MTLLRYLLLAAALLTLPLPAWSWGPVGHQIVGALAERQLRPVARAEVARLLVAEPAPSLAGVANWADDVRAAETPATRNTSRWHFINFKSRDCNYVPVRDCPDGNCVVGAINRNFLALADRARPDAERREALKFLVHFIGDVHQPLHASSRDDRGGNDYQIAYQGMGRNLHAVWDTLIVQRRGLSSADYADWLAQQSALPPDPTRLSDRPAVDWAVESCRMVEQPGFYPGGHVIDNRYLDANRALVELRLRRAGARLADMINYALDPRLPVTR